MSGLTAFLAKRYLAVLTLVVAGLALHAGVRALQGSCIDRFAPADSPATTAAEETLLLSEARSLYQQERYDYSVPNARLAKPLKADVSGRAAGLVIDGPIYAGDFRYAQLWQQVYERYHLRNNCVHLQLLWKNGSVAQQFPPTDL